MCIFAAIFNIIFIVNFATKIIFLLNDFFSCHIYKSEQIDSIFAITKIFHFTISIVYTHHSFKTVIVYYCSAIIFPMSVEKAKMVVFSRFNIFSCTSYVLYIHPPPPPHKMTPENEKKHN